MPLGVVGWALLLACAAPVAGFPAGLRIKVYFDEADDVGSIENASEVRAGVHFDLIVDGVSFDDPSFPLPANRISIKPSGTCGEAGSDASDPDVVVPAAAPNGFYNSSAGSPVPMQSWWDVVILRPDAFDVCWCAGQCDASEGSYAAVADGLTVHGPAHPAREELQIVANPFRLKFSFKIPRDTDRFSIIPLGVENVACGSDAALSYGSTYSATSAPYAVVEDEMETWVDTVVHEVGSYQVCWCGRSSCSRAAYYNIVAIHLTIGGPTTSGFATLEAGWPLSFDVHGVALGADDRISIVAAGVQCGTDAATATADTVVFSNAEADGLGAPQVIDPTYVVWSGFTISTPGSYTICWVGNFSSSYHCVEPTSATECSGHASTNFPHTLATLTVDYGRVAMYGETDIDSCSGLWIDALPPSHAAKQLEWACTPASSNICNHVMAVSDSLVYLGSQEWQGSLYASVPASVWSSALGGSSQQSFELTVTLLDLDDMTRRGSATVTVSSGIPRVTSGDSQVAATIGGSFRLEVHVWPPPEADCTATSPGGLDVSVSWLLDAPGGMEFPVLAVQGSAISEVDWAGYLDFSSSAVAALGVGAHRIEAHVSAASEGGVPVTKVMYFEVSVGTLASPVAVLAAPDVAVVGCPLVLDASGSYDPVELSASLSYRWGCVPVGVAACPDLEASDGAFRSVQLGEASLGQLIFSVTVISSTGSRQHAASRTVEVQVNTTSGPSERIGTLAVSPVLAVGGQLFCAASTPAECGAPGESAWALVREETSELAAIEQALDTREVSVVDLQTGAATSIAMFVATVQSSMLVVGGQYRCVLRSDGQDLQSTSAFALAVAPWNGQIILSPQEGTALQTDFLMAAEGWVSDALPIEYAFAILNVSSAEDSGDGSFQDQPAYLRGYDPNHCMYCRLGFSGLVTVATMVRDNLGSESHASKQVEIAAPSISDATASSVLSLVKGTPTVRAVTTSTVAILSAATEAPTGSVSDAAAFAATLLGDYWSVLSVTEDDAEVGSEDVRVRAWVLDQALRFAYDGTISESLGEVAGALLVFLTQECTAHPNLKSLDPIDSDTVRLFLSSMQLLLARPALAGSVRTSESSLGDAMFARLRRNGLLWFSGAAVWDEVSVGDLALSVGRVPRLQAAEGLQSALPGLYVQLPALAAGRRLTASEAGCADGVDLQLTRWAMSPTGSAASGSFLDMEGSLSGLIAAHDFPGPLGASGPFYATVRSKGCPGALVSPAVVAVRFDVAEGTAPRGLQTEVLQGVELNTYAVNVSWVCAQWDAAARRWAASPDIHQLNESSLNESSPSTSLECALQAGVQAGGLMAVAAVPVASFELLHTQIADPAPAGGIVWDRLWALVGATAVVQLLLLCLCVPAPGPEEPAVLGAAFERGLRRQEAGEARSCMLVPAALFFNGLFGLTPVKLFSWPRSRAACGRRRKSRVEVDDVEPIGGGEAQAAERSYSAVEGIRHVGGEQPPLRSEVLAAAKESLAWRRQMQQEREQLLSPPRRYCYLFQVDTFERHYRSLLLAAMREYRAVVLMSETVRREEQRQARQERPASPAWRGRSRRSVADAVGSTVEAIFWRDPWVEPIKLTGVEDEPLHLRAAHHAQQQLLHFAVRSKIGLSDSERRSLRHCQEVLRRLMDEGADPGRDASGGGSGRPALGAVRPQRAVEAKPCAAPPGALRLTLLSLESTQRPPEPPEDAKAAAGAAAQSAWSGALGKIGWVDRGAAGPAKGGGGNAEPAGVEKGVVAGSWLGGLDSAVGVVPGPPVGAGGSGLPVAGSGGGAQLAEQLAADARSFFASCGYFLWPHGRALFLHRAEIPIQDPLSVTTPLDLSLASHEMSRRYSLDEDVQEIIATPGDDRILTLTLRTGLKFTFRNDGEVRPWLYLLKSGPAYIHNPKPVKLLEVLWPPAYPSRLQSPPAAFQWRSGDERRRSSFLYTVSGAMPHTACSAVLETSDQREVPTMMWYSHGGTVLTFVLAPGGGFERDGADGLAPRPVAAADADPDDPGRPRPEETRPGAQEAPGERPGEDLPSVAYLGEGELETKALGVYAADIEAAEERATLERGARHSFQLCLLLADGASLRIFFRSHVVLRQFWCSIMGLRSRVLPTTPLPQIHSSRRKMGLSQGWDGVRGCLELKVLSACGLGLTDPASKATLHDLVRRQSLGRAEAAKPPDVEGKPVVQLRAYIPHHLPPRRCEVRMTPPLPERTCNPVWRNVFLTTVSFEASDPRPGNIRLEVWDVGSTYKHRFLGEAYAPFPDRPCRRQYQLKLEHNPSKMDDATKIVNGYVSFQVKFGPDDLPCRAQEDLALISAKESHSVTGQLVLTISRAKALPRSDVLPTSDPYCLVYVATGPKQVASWRTTTKLAARNPVWDETKEFSINWPKSEVGEAAIVRVEVWDYDLASGDDFLGEVTFPLPGAECDDALDLELQPNRRKGAVVTRGRLSVQLLFKEQFSQLEEPEAGLTPYEKAFARYHGARPANDPLARAVGSGLLFFHLGPRRLLAGLLPPAFRRASGGLLRGPRELREQRYWLLSCSLWSALAVAALVLWLVRDEDDWGGLADRPRACGAGLGLLLGTALLNPASVLGDFAWQRLGSGGALPAAGDPAAPFSRAVTLASWLGVAVCLGRARDHEALAFLYASGCLLLTRALVRPLGASLLQCYALLRAQWSDGFDRLIWWYPSLLNVHGLLQ